jgi:putative ABC transport system permease protein
VNFQHFYKIPDKNTVKKILEEYNDSIEEEGIRVSTVENAKGRIGDQFERLAGFMYLVAFIALLLGAIGVASTIHVYMKEKISPIAILRCLGAKSKSIFKIYLIQISFLGFIGSTIGSFLGVLVQYLLPLVFRDFFTN